MKFVSPRINLNEKEGKKKRNQILLTSFLKVFRMRFLCTQNSKMRNCVQLRRNWHPYVSEKIHLKNLNVKRNIVVGLWTQKEILICIIDKMNGLGLSDDINVLFPQSESKKFFNLEGLTKA